MSDERDANTTIWSSDGKTPYEECVSDIHVYYSDNCYGKSRSLEGTKCVCEKTYWHYVTCDCCHYPHGESVKFE